MTIRDAWLATVLAILWPAGAAAVEPAVDASSADTERLLRRQLAGRSYILVYVEDPGSRGARLESALDLGVGGAGGAGTAADVTAADRTDALTATPSALGRQALLAPDAAERAAAFELIAYRDGASRAAETLTRGLDDPDETVRARALEAIKDTQEVLPATAVARVAREDASAARRIQALELLAERTEAASVPDLRRALSDTDASVRARAEELLADLHLPADRAGAPGPAAVASSSGLARSGR